jgi:hypothetical protein
MNDQDASAFLKDIRHPLLGLHRSLLTELRARHEAEFGPMSPAEFLQVVINGTEYRWLGPLSTLIAALDDVLDNPEATRDDRRASAQAVIAMFSATTRDAAFAERYLPMLQASPEIALAHGRVTQLVRAVAPPPAPDPQD